MRIMCTLFFLFQNAFCLITLFLPLECSVSTKRKGKKKAKIKGKEKGKDKRKTKG